MPRRRKHAHPRLALSHAARPAREVASDVMFATADITGDRTTLAPCPPRHPGVELGFNASFTLMDAITRPHPLRHAGLVPTSTVPHVQRRWMPFLHSSVPYMFRAEEAARGA